MAGKATRRSTSAAMGEMRKREAMRPRGVVPGEQGRIQRATPPRKRTQRQMWRGGGSRPRRKRKGRGVSSAGAGARPKRSRARQRVVPRARKGPTWSRPKRRSWVSSTAPTPRRDRADATAAVMGGSWRRISLPESVDRWNREFIGRWAIHGDGDGDGDLPNDGGVRLRGEALGSQVVLGPLGGLSSGMAHAAGSSLVHRGRRGLERGARARAAVGARG
mmetsp:Transcript_3510/g.7283  ORF Transcript_3510/g.7283 Transcript_3510/m.7283 type:complete len:219 (+) Transcript_3510:321-977(+)